MNSINNKRHRNKLNPRDTSLTRCLLHHTTRSQAPCSSRSNDQYENAPCPIVGEQRINKQMHNDNTSKMPSARSKSLRRNDFLYFAAQLSHSTIVDRRLVHHRTRRIANHPSRDSQRYTQSEMSLSWSSCTCQLRRSAAAASSDTSGNNKAPHRRISINDW